MKILLVNRYLYPSGGDATYTLSLARLLRDHGHEVIGFGLQDPGNDGSLKTTVLMEPIDFPALLDKPDLRGSIRVIRRAIYSDAARIRMDRLLAKEKPDLVHLQNIHHHLSPSVISAAARRRIPVIWTLHDFTVICPNGNLLSRGRVCEECRPARFHRAVINRCKRGSLGASLVAALESSVHRIAGLFQPVDRFIAPSRFLAAKLREFDFFPDRVVQLDNFVERGLFRNNGSFPHDDSGSTGPGYMFFGGRLHPDKGIRTLLLAAERWGGIPLKICGTGPMREDVRNASRRIPHIEYLGHLDRARLGAVLSGALAVVVPSECYENQPYSVLEGYSAGRPVVGAGHGGLLDLVENGKNGLLFRPGDPDGLATAVRRMAGDPIAARRMGIEGRRMVRSRFSPEAHYRGLMSIYQEARSRGYGRVA